MPVPVRLVLVPGTRFSATLWEPYRELLPVVGGARMADALNALMRVLGARGAYASSLPDASAYAVLPAAWAAVMAECGPQLLAGVECPVVLANGQFDQMRAHVRRFADRCRQVEVVTIPGATHLFPVTHPRQVAEVLREGVRLARA